MPLIDQYNNSRLGPKSSLIDAIRRRTSPGINSISDIELPSSSPGNTGFIPPIPSGITTGIQTQAGNFLVTQNGDFITQNQS